MLTFIEFILVFFAGLTLAHLTSKENKKGPFISFLCLCSVPAFLLTVFLFLFVFYLSPIVQHIYVAIVCLLALGKVKEYRDRMSNE